MSYMVDGYGKCDVYCAGILSYCSPTVLLMGIALLLVCLRIEHSTRGRGARVLRRVGAATWCMYIANGNPVLWAWRRDRLAFLAGFGPVGLVAGAMAIATVEIVAAMALGLVIDAAFEAVRLRPRLDAAEDAMHRKLKMRV